MSKNLLPTKISTLNKLNIYRTPFLLEIRGPVKSYKSLLGLQLMRRLTPHAFKILVDVKSDIAGFFVHRYHSLKDEIIFCTNDVGDIAKLSTEPEFEKCHIFIDSFGLLYPPDINKPYKSTMPILHELVKRLKCYIYLVVEDNLMGGWLSNSTREFVDYSIEMKPGESTAKGTIQVYERHLCQGKHNYVFENETLSISEEPLLL